MTGPAWLWLFRRWADGQYLPGTLAFAAIILRIIQLRRPERGMGADGNAAPSRLDAVMGAILVLGAGITGWTAAVIESSVLLGWCFPVLVAGLCLQWRGATACRLYLPLSAYAFLVFPLPGIMASSLSLPIRLTAARIAVWILRGLGIDCIQSGVVVETLRYRAAVVPACGGAEVIHLFLVVIQS